MPAEAPKRGDLSGSKPAIVTRLSSPCGGCSKIMRRRSSALEVLRRIQPWAPIALKRSTLVAGSLSVVSSTRVTSWPSTEKS